MRRSDLRRLSALLRHLAEQIDQRGDHAWTVTRQWRTGPRAATLETTRVRALGDPTGRDALAGDPDPHAAYLRQLAGIARLAFDLERVLRDVGPPRAPVCYWMALQGVNVLATRTIDGQPACDWCYRRALDTGRPPTPSEIRQRTGGAARVARGTR